MQGQAKNRIRQDLAGSIVQRTKNYELRTKN